MYVVVSGSPESKFNVVDLETNTLIRSLDIANSNSSSWGLAVDSQGNVYVNGRAILYKYTPGAESLERLGVPIPGEHSIWAMLVDENDNLYGGTYGGPDREGKIFKYDPVTNEFTDYGAMHPGRGYVRSMAYYNGHIYAGLGSQGDIVKFNPADGTKELIAIPQQLLVGSSIEGKAPFVYSMTIERNLLFATLNGNDLKRLIIYDLEAEQWLDKMYDGVSSAGIITQEYGDRVYFSKDESLYSFDLTMHTIAKTEENGALYKGSGWFELDNEPTLALLEVSGHILLYQPNRSASMLLRPVVEAANTSVHTIENGPDGKLYISGYLGGMGARFDPAQRTVEKFALGQMESIGVMNGKVYMGNYPKAGIYVLDPQQPLGGENPKLLFSIGHSQDRPYVFATDGTRGYFGTIPEYGLLGGALVIFEDHGTSVDYSVYPNLIRNQSIVGLAYRDGKIYGSTSIYGGVDPQAPYEERAKMFVFDVEQETLITEFVPELPGAAADPKVINGLVFGPDGLLWAAADGFVFAVDPESLEVVKYKNMYPDVVGYGMWRPVHMRWGADGLLYTDAAGYLTIVQPQTMEHMTVYAGRNPVRTEVMTLGHDGNLYYEDGVNLKMIEVTDVQGPDAPPPFLLNASFEEPLINGNIPGWTSGYLMVPGVSSFEVTSERAFSGDKSLKLVSNSTNTQVWLRQANRPVTPGFDYTGRAMMYLESADGSTAPNATVFMRFFDASNKQVGSDIIRRNVETGKWVEMTLPTTKAPENAAYAVISAYLRLADIAVAYFDDFSISSPQEYFYPGALELDYDGEIRDFTTFDVKVRTSGAAGLYAYEALLSYDASMVAPVAAEGSSAFESFDWSVIEPGLIKLTGRKDGYGSVNGGAEAATVTFEGISTDLSLTQIRLLGQSKTANLNMYQASAWTAIGYDRKVEVRFSQQWAGSFLLEGPESVIIGEPFDISVHLWQARDVYAIETILDYDPELVQLTGYAAGEGLQNGFVLAEDRGGQVKLIGTITGADRGVTAEFMEAARFTFTALQQSGPAGFVLKAGTAFAQSDADVTGELHVLQADIPLNVTILHEPEDVNGNGSIEITDLVAVAKNINKAVTDETRRYDVNRDGSINIADVSLIALRLMTQ